MCSMLEVGKGLFHIYCITPGGHLICGYCLIGETFLLQIGDFDLLIDWSLF